MVSKFSAVALSVTKTTHPDSAKDCTRFLIGSIKITYAMDGILSKAGAWGNSGLWGWMFSVIVGVHEESRREDDDW